MNYARRRRLIVGAGAGFLILALIAPLVAGLLPSEDPEPTAVAPPPTASVSTEPTAPSTTVDVSGMPPAAQSCPAEDGSSPRTTSFDGPPPMCIDVERVHVAVFDTSEGEIRVTLDTADTPITANNFVSLARWGYYDGTTLFRTDPSIDIIQGGAPHTESPSDPGPGYRIPDEPQFDLNPDTGALTGPYRYEPGQLVMARAAGRDSAGAQFFFSTGPNTANLDGQGIYVVFGETDAAGLDVLQSIIGLHVPGPSLGGAPSRTVTVNSVTIEVT